jgi:hypothetical protein
VLYLVFLTVMWGTTCLTTGQSHVGHHVKFFAYPCGMVLFKYICGLSPPYSFCFTFIQSGFRIPLGSFFRLKVIYFYMRHSMAGGIVLISF